MELAVITYPEIFEGEALVLTQLLEQFDIMLHIRKPWISDEEYKDLIKQIPAELLSKVFIHTAYELTEEFEFKGLHFSTEKREQSNQFEDTCKSTSTHSVEEVELLHEAFDYMFLSPVYPSISKPGLNNVLNKSDIREQLSREWQGKIIALGGVSAENLEEIKQLGFDGAAVLGAIWGEELANITNAEQNLKEIYQCLF